MRGTVSYIQLSLLTAAFCLIICKAFSWFKPGKRHKSPPSPPAIPLLGHMHLFRKEEPSHQTLARLARTYGPYMLLKFGSNSALVVSSVQGARELFKTHDVVFSSRPQTTYAEAFSCNGTNLLFAPYGHRWRQLRKLCTLELLTVRRVEYFRPIRAAEMLSFLEKLRGSATRKELVNMTKSLSDFTFNVVLKMIMGKSYMSVKDEGNADARQAYLFQELFIRATKLTGHFRIGDCFPSLMFLDFSMPTLRKICSQMEDFVQVQLEEHLANFDKDHLKDFMDVMISVSDDGKLFGEARDTTIKALTIDMVGAGTETSATTVEWTLGELANNPSIMRKVHEELDAEVPPGEEMVTEEHLPKLKYLHAVVKETFRLHPPVPLLVPRESTSECELGEEQFVIRGKTQAMVNVYAIGRDPTLWEEPLKFKPERMLGRNVEVGQSFEVLPFGYGRRSCPGLHLGMITVQFILANLLYKFAWTSVDGSVDLTEGCGFTLQLAKPLHLIPVAR